MRLTHLKIPWLEVSVVLFEMVIMLLFAWSFTAGPPSAAFLALVESWGITYPVNLVVAFVVAGAVLSPLTLCIRSRFYQRMWYGACAGPLVFYAAAIGYYRVFVQPGNVTSIIVYLAFAAALWLLAATTFRDLKVKD